MARYKQLKEKTEERQTMLTDLHNAIVDALNDKDDDAVILCTSNHKVVSNMVSNDYVIKALESYAKAMREQEESA